MDEFLDHSHFGSIIDLLTRQINVSLDMPQRKVGRPLDHLEDSIDNIQAPPGSPPTFFQNGIAIAMGCREVFELHANFKSNVASLVQERPRKLETVAAVYGYGEKE